MSVGLDVCVATVAADGEEQLKTRSALHDELRRTFGQQSAPC